jgi:putative SOS response-associated peptidase YedK
MCAHYENIRDPRVIRDHFKAEPTHVPVRADVWPGYLGSFIMRPREADYGDEAVAERVEVPGVFGLLPHWAKDEKLSRHTYNARSETVAEKPSFRDSWRKARHCIIPAAAIWEPDWGSGKAVATRIERADGKPMGIAGLWDQWRNPKGEWVYSCTMLTINADAHAFMRQFHRPGDEKRTVVILPEKAYGDWLTAGADQSRGFLQAWPAEGLVRASRPPGHGALDAPAAHNGPSAVKGLS